MMKDKKGDILRAALVCLGEGQNPNEIKIAEIARRAGVGKGTVYEYFTSKQELFAESVLCFMSECLAKLQQAGGSGSFRERFFAVLKVLSGCLDNCRPLFYTVFLHQQFCSPEAEAAQRMLSRQPEVERELLLILDELLRQAEAEGLFPRREEQDSLFAFSCVVGALCFAGCSPTKQGRDLLFEKCYQTFLKLNQ